MIHVSSRAANKLREELVQKCLDAGIGFRISVNNDEMGNITSNMRFDRQRSNDVVIELGGVKLFSAPDCVAQVKEYHLDYLDNPDGGFFLIKRAIEASLPR